MQQLCAIRRLACGVLGVVAFLSWSIQMGVNTNYNNDKISVAVTAYGWESSHFHSKRGYYCCHPLVTALRNAAGDTPADSITAKDNLLGETNNKTSDSLSLLSQQVRSLRKIVLHQQRQLDELHETLRTVTLPQATLFVDGTWLYYSLYERSTISNHFRIPYWHYHFEVDWKAVLRMLNREFNVMIKDQYVFTSAKPLTHTSSPRYMLFESLRDAGFNVDIQETVGPGEKCVDIKLATQMIAQDFAVGIILTGDKDFLPALTLCRQKQGKKIGLFSMREGCNRALSELDNVRDFDVVWLEDHIKEIFISKSTNNGQQVIRSTLPQFSDSDFAALDLIYQKVTYDFIVESGAAFAHARDLGRHMKKVPLLDTTILDLIKSFRGSLTAFVSSNDAFVVDYSNQDKDTWTIAWNSKNPPPSLEKAPSSASHILSKFQENYTDQFVQAITRNKAVAYEFTLETLRERGLPLPAAKPNITDYESMKKDELQKACTDCGLSKSGTKAELIARLTEHQSVAHDSSLPPVHDYIVDLIVKFVKSQTGRVGSRAVGRYLSQCKPFDAFHSSALVELKASYGNLYDFIVRSNSELVVESIQDFSSEFMVVFTGPMSGESEPSTQSALKPTFEHLKALLESYLLSHGGTMGSRDIGRHLASCEAYDKKYGDALAELKAIYGNLLGFIERSEGYFKNNGVLQGKEFSVSVETESSVVS